MYGALTNHPPTPQHTLPADVTKSQGEQSHSKSLVTIYIKSEDTESQWGEDAFPKSGSGQLAMLGFESRHSVLPCSHGYYYTVGLGIVTRDRESGKASKALCPLAGGFLSVDLWGLVCPVQGRLQKRCGIEWLRCTEVAGLSVGKPRM